MRFKRQGRMHPSWLFDDKYEINLRCTRSNGRNDTLIILENGREIFRYAPKTNENQEIGLYNQ